MIIAAVKSSLERDDKSLGGVVRRAVLYDASRKTFKMTETRWKLVIREYLNSGTTPGGG